MAYRPPAGLRPPQLEGKRTGRPKGSWNYAVVFKDILWGFEHRFHERAAPPNSNALWWWRMALMYPDEVEEFLVAWGRM